MKRQLKRTQELLNQPASDPDEIVSLLKPFMKKKDTPWIAYHFMGMALFKKKTYDKAVPYFKKAIEKESDDPGTFHFLSKSCFQNRQYEESEKYARNAVELKDDYFPAWMQLAAAYREQGKLNEALKCYQKANQIDPKSAEVAFRIASIYRDQGNIEKALELFEITIKIEPGYLEAYTEKANILRRKKRTAEAEECLMAALQRDENFIKAEATLAELYKGMGDYGKAIDIYEKLLQSHPAVTGLRVNYALCLLEIGEFEESEKHYLRAFQEDAGIVEALSNYLMGLHYNPRRTKEEIFEAHKLWDEHYSGKKPDRPIPENTGREKKLRIGLLSGGFRSHPVGWMITPALENLPADEFEIYCYTTNSSIDFITKRIHARCDCWRSVIGYDEEVIARMIRDDQIDILVELSGHSADNRLRTVNLEPAPVIVKWVGGLFNTTGMQSVDYLITDRHETPAGEEKFYTEKLVRMPDDYICFLPPDYAPAVEELPAIQNGAITFGCFNNPAKINSDILEIWAEILNRIPSSRLFLKSKQYDTEALRDRIIKKMKECGIAEERLMFEGQSPHSTLLATYNRVDIALDPWPYSGGLTTCEALWMGVPVITKPGPTFAGRHSTTHLMNAGLPEWVAETWDEYIGKAVTLAKNMKKLAELRSVLRERVAHSPLCDGDRFGRHLSAAFREMWEQRVDGYEKNNDEWQGHIYVDPRPETNANGMLNDSLNIHGSSGAGEKPNREKAESMSQEFSLLKTEIPHSKKISHQNGGVTIGGEWLKTLNAIIRHTKPLVKKKHGLPSQLIVSLTSFPKRFSTLHLTLACLLNQTVKPDKIILWIAHDDKPHLSSKTLELQNSGFDIRFCEDIRSYKKIIPTLRHFPDACIVTADDDVYYWQTWLEELVEAWKENSDSVIAHRVHRVLLDEKDQPRDYAKWNFQFSENTIPSGLNFPTGIGGVLYPPGIFHSDVTDKKRFMKYCPHGDDIWLYWMYRLNGVKVRITGKNRNFITWPETQKGALWKNNLARGENDRQIKNVLREYGFPHGEKTGGKQTESGAGFHAIGTKDSGFLEPVHQLVEDLNDTNTKANELRKRSMAQKLRREAVKVLLSQSTPDDSYLHQYLTSFNRLTKTAYTTWKETLFHSFEFDAVESELAVAKKAAKDLCRPAKELTSLTKEVSCAGFEAIVHGSLSDGKYTPYSDVDISVFVDPEYLADHHKRKKVKTDIDRINRAITHIDPIGHHGCFINLKTDLSAYPEANMPLKVLNGGFSLNLNPVEHRVHTRNSSDFAFLTLQELSLFFINLPSKTFKQDAITLKNIISRFFIINLLHYELFYDSFLDKRSILTNGLTDIASQDQMDCIEIMTEIREKWPACEENKMGYMSDALIQKSARAASDILKHLTGEGHLDRIRKQWLIL